MSVLAVSGWRVGVDVAFEERFDLRGPGPDSEFGDKPARLVSWLRHREHGREHGSKIRLSTSPGQSRRVVCHRAVVDLGQPPASLAHDPVAIPFTDRLCGVGSLPGRPSRRVCDDRGETLSQKAEGRQSQEAGL